jgi:hypothetical protein
MYLQALKRLYARIPTAEAVGSVNYSTPTSFTSHYLLQQDYRVGVETDSDWATVNILNEPLVTTIP